ncbi:hypothetical protein B0H10DRAFT_2198123, partial [Mycena sp. CBHHK59/15]
VPVPRPFATFSADPRLVRLGIPRGPLHRSAATLRLRRSAAAAAAPCLHHPHSVPPPHHPLPRSGSCTSSTTSFTSTSLGSTTATPTNAPPDSQLLFQTLPARSPHRQAQSGETSIAGRAAKHSPRRRSIARDAERSSARDQRPRVARPKIAFSDKARLSPGRVHHVKVRHVGAQFGDVQLAQPKCSSFEALPAPYH